MIGHRMLAWIDKRLRQATGQLDQPLGGLSVILFGDFGQLPPVSDRPLYADPSNSDLSIHGHTIYCLFTTVVILKQVLRQSGSDPSTHAFRELLLRLRDGKATNQDWKALLQRSPHNASNVNEFTDAVRLFYDKESVAKYNLEKLHTLETPIARVNAINSNHAATTASSDDACGLQPVTYIAKQARVMLTSNLWQSTGLCNGAAGTVHEILYHEGHQPPDLPLAVLIDFDTYTGPPFLSNRPRCVPIPPQTFEWESSGQRLSRQQLPLLLRYAITIHKSQGQTLHKAVINIGKSEMAAGCTFVAVSRLRRLEDGLFEPMSYQRLEAISSGKRLIQRLNEDRLTELAAQHHTDL